jgi:glutathione S-transferase
MTLTLHQHPFAAYCWKAMIAIEERGVPVVMAIVEGEQGRERLAELWPMASIPVLVDEGAGLTVPESTTIVEYLDAFGAAPPLVPADGLQARLWDRVIDGHVMTPMQKIVGDSLRPADRRDPEGVEQAHAEFERAYALLEAQVDGAWLAGEAFTLADCAAAPALHYARILHRWDEPGLPRLTRYFDALMARPSVARVIDGARPYRELFPLPWPDYVD